MLRDMMKKRFTSRWWTDDPVEDDKLATILECAYYTPSKQGYYDYEIYAITDSPEGKEFKQWLYWEGSACLDKVLSPTSNGGGLRKYNGQVLAPVVLVWLAKQFPKDPNQYRESEWLRTNNDCHMSAGVAMCQAQELGLATGWCGTLMNAEVAEKLGRPELTAVTSLGIGYAFTIRVPMRMKVFKDDVEVGYDLSNLHPSNKNHFSRELKQPMNIMIKRI